MSTSSKLSHLPVSNKESFLDTQWQHTVTTTIIALLRMWCLKRKVLSIWDNWTAHEVRQVSIIY